MFYDECFFVTVLNSSRGKFTTLQIHFTPPITILLIFSLILNNGDFLGSPVQGSSSKFQQTGWFICFIIINVTGQGILSKYVLNDISVRQHHKRCEIRVLQGHTLSRIIKSGSCAGLYCKLLNTLAQMPKSGKYNHYTQQNSRFCTCMKSYLTCPEYYYVAIYFSRKNFLSRCNCSKLFSSASQGSCDSDDIVDGTPPHAKQPKVILKKTL